MPSGGTKRVAEGLNTQVSPPPLTVAVTVPVPVAVVPWNCLPEPAAARLVSVACSGWAAPSAVITALKLPCWPLATKAGDMAVPSAPVVALAVTWVPPKLAEGPLAGRLNSTATPALGWPWPSTTRTIMRWP